MHLILSGGVGGAKLVLGFREILAASEFQVVANTGDDFDHLGLPICPDIDTLIYTLAGEVNPETGWGLRGESWQFMEALEQLGGDTWFRLGDRDIATHIRRRELLAAGQTLSDVTTALRQAFGVRAGIWPMSDQPVRTIVDTDAGPLEFQDYFVRHKALPRARGFRYTGSANAQAAGPVISALESPRLAAIVITPSNPWLSIDPILSVSDIKTRIKASKVPVVAVSPIVGGRAIKGPTAKLMQETGIEPCVASIAEHYQDILDGLVMDKQDADQQDRIEAMGIHTTITDTVMVDLEDKAKLAADVRDFAAGLANGSAA